jgi:hypothetical protein
MMTRSLTTLLLLYLLPLKAADLRLVTVSVRNVSVTTADTSDPDYVTLGISFDATAHGQDGIDLHVASEPVFYTGVDRLLGSEGWTTILEPFRVDTVPVKYKNCSTVKKGETFEFPHIQADAVLKKTDEEAHSGVVLRFRLAAACLTGGRMVDLRLITEPIKINVPPW